MCFQNPGAQKLTYLVPGYLLRYDPGVVVSAIGRYLPDLLSSGPDAMKLTGPFSKVSAK
jgi:hypothetical protein